MVRTLLPGTSLAQLMEEKGAPPARTEEILLCMVRLCGFLDELHANGRGWLFWELTPDHIMVDPQQGFEPSFVGCSHFRMLRDGIAMDCVEEEALGWAAVRPDPGYAAPEVLSGGSASVAVDLYGLGALLFHLFSGIDPRSLAEELLEAQGLTSPHERALALGHHDAAQEFCATLRGRIEHLCRRNLKGLGIHRARMRRLMLRLLSPAPEVRGLSPLEVREEILGCLARSTTEV